MSDLLTAVEILHRLDGEMYSRRFYWRHERALIDDSELMQEQWNRLLGNLGLKEENIESVFFSPVPVTLPTKRQDVTLGFSA